MIKTKENVIIPLSEKAKRLIPERSFENQFVFPVFTGQVSNRYLKKIVKAVKIDKKITFHCARHTFATISRSEDIEYDTISKLLGHTDIKTTEIYTKYELEHLTREIEKWNN